MKATRLHAVDLVRKIRDRHARRLAGKTPNAIIAFYRAAGEAALLEVQLEPKVQRRKAGSHALHPTAARVLSGRG